MRICRRCGKEFAPTNGKRKFKTCEKCRLRLREAQKKWREKQKILSSKNPQPPSIHLDETERERADYNQKNNTYLSYGKYVAMKWLEKNKIVDDEK